MHELKIIDKEGVSLHGVVHHCESISVPGSSLINMEKETVVISNSW